MKHPIYPFALGSLMTGETEKASRGMLAILQMRKIDLNKLVNI